MDSEQLEVIQLLDKDIDLLKKGIREERGKLPDVIKTSFSESQLADPNMLDLFVDLLQLSRQHLTGPQSRAVPRDKSVPPLQAWPVLEVVPDTRPSPLLVQCRTCARMLRAEVFHEHVTGCQSRAESRGSTVSRTRDSSPAPRLEDSEESGTEERSRDHVSERASQEVTRDMSTVARDLSPLARELVKKIGVEHSKRKRDTDPDDEGPKKKRKLSNEPSLIPKKEIATTIEVSPPVNQSHVSAPTAIDTWTAEEHDDRMTLKKMLMSKNGNKSAEDVKELLQFIKTVPPRPLVFTNDDDELYFWHQSRTPSSLPVATRAARDRRAHRLRRAGVSVSALPSSELVRSEYRYSVPNRQLKLTPQQVLLQQTVKIALLSGLLHQNDASTTGNKQLRSSKGRVRANNSATPPPLSAAATPAASEKSGTKTSEVLTESEPVDEKSLLAKLLQLEPSAPAANNSSSTATATAVNTPSTVPPTANNSNNVTAVSTPVPVTTAPSTSIAVPATPINVTPVTGVTPTPATAKTSHMPTALLVPNAALSATLMKDIAFKGKAGSGVPLTAVTLLHPTQLQGANIKMQVKGKVPSVTHPKTAPPTTGVKVAPGSVTPKQISPKPTVTAVKQPPLLAKPVLDSALLGGSTVLAGNRVAVLPITSATPSALMRANNVAGRVVSSMPVVLTTAAKPLVAPPNAVVPPTVPAKKSAAKK